MNLLRRLLGWFTDYQPMDNSHKAKLNNLYYTAGWNAAKADQTYNPRPFKQYSQRLIDHLKKIDNLRGQRTIIKVLRRTAAVRRKTGKHPAPSIH